MPLYLCEFCNLSTKLKTDYERHLLTNKHYKNVKEYDANMEKKNKMSQKEPKRAKMSQNEPTNELEELSCEYCAETFSTKANKRRHEKYRCKSNDARFSRFVEMQHKMLENSEKEKKELYKQIEKLIDKAGNTTINTQNTHNTQNTQNNINLNGYGKEDLSHITDSLKTQLLAKPYAAIPKMIEHIHFNDKKPENKNISLPNKKDNKIKVFCGDKWIYKIKDEIINDLVDGKYFILDCHYEDNCNKLSKSTQSNFEKFQTFYDDEDKKFIDSLKQECELVLLNNR